MDPMKSSKVSEGSRTMSRPQWFGEGTAKPIFSKVFPRTNFFLNISYPSLIEIQKESYHLVVIFSYSYLIKTNSQYARNFST